MDCGSSAGITKVDEEELILGLEDDDDRKTGVVKTLKVRRSGRGLH